MKKHFYLVILHFTIVVFAILSLTGCEDLFMSPPDQENASQPPASATYTVTFESNGGNSVSSQTLNSGGTVTCPANPTRSYYIFVDWYNDSGLTTLYNFSTPVKGNITLYAKWNPVVIEMVQITAGKFTMGSPTTEVDRSSDETQHWVTLSGFYMSKYLVTQEQYQAVMGTNPSNFKTAVSGESGTPGKLPVERVSWYDAIVFCNRLSIAEGLSPVYRISGSTDPSAWGSVPTSSNAIWNTVEIVAGSNGYCLPTEAQWEYACRAGTLTAYNTGNNTVSVDTGWYYANSGDKTHKVGLKPANDWGLYDMHGNVFEWCWDWYGNYLDATLFNDPMGKVDGSYRVKRGGCWSYGTYTMRSACRTDTSPYACSDSIGFRLVRGAVTVHTVTFESDNGYGATTKSVTSGNTVPRPENPQKSGYFFDNWYSDKALTTVYNFSTQVKGNITLYAKWNPIVIEMVKIPAGIFTMGSPSNETGRFSDEGPQHQVTQSGFYMGKYEVTQEQYHVVMETNLSNFTAAINGENGTPGKLPVECVSWYDTIVFCNKLSIAQGLSPAYRISGSTDPEVWGYPFYNTKWDTVEIVAGSNGYRLPTEAQWEYACRAGTTTVYNTGNTVNNNTGWYNGNSGSKTHQVGLKSANAWGLYDMHGNVYEWCWDWYDIYSGTQQTDPLGPSSGSHRVIRGGSWGHSSFNMRSAFRLNADYPHVMNPDIGFRVVRP
jgi:uncharacterized repeat protein (TIGR02543 family)